MHGAPDHDGKDARSVWRAVRRLCRRRCAREGERAAVAAGSGGRKSLVRETACGAWQPRGARWADTEGDEAEGTACLRSTLATRAPNGDGRGQEEGTSSGRAFCSFILGLSWLHVRAGARLVSWRAARGLEWNVEKAARPCQSSTSCRAQRHRELRPSLDGCPINRALARYPELSGGDFVDERGPADEGE